MSAPGFSAVLGESAAETGRYGAPIINDNTDERVSLTAEFLGAVDEGVSLADGPVVLLHVTLQPVSAEEQDRISLYEPLMQGQQYTSDLTTTFTGVDVDGSLVADVTSLLSPTLLATAAGGGAVQLDWMCLEKLAVPRWHHPTRMSLVAWRLKMRKANRRCDNNTLPVAIIIRYLME